MSIDWSNIEVELIIADYFNMLALELKGEKYSKAEHRRALLPLLNNRSEGSIEFKHQNISAVLASLGQPYIKGYLPRYNYQHILETKVIERLSGKENLTVLFKNFADRKPKILKPTNYNKIVEAAPESEEVNEPQSSYLRKTVKINYLEREQQNRHLGSLGEEMVLDYEKWFLRKQGKNKYANQVYWISKEEGDGVGYDILSRDLLGNHKFIEVKTTKLSKKTPIFFSKNELDFSIENKDKFYLYRLFNFEQNAGMFIKHGALNQVCQASPISFKGFF